MASTVYVKNLLTGGTATALDGINGSLLVEGDIAFVVFGPATNVVRVYYLDADSAADESSPDIIKPDVSAGDKRWILQTATP